MTTTLVRAASHQHLHQLRRPGDPTFTWTPSADPSGQVEQADAQRLTSSRPQPATRTLKIRRFTEVFCWEPQLPEVEVEERLGSHNVSCIFFVLHERVMEPDEFFVLSDHRELVLLEVGEGALWRGKKSV